MRFKCIRQTDLLSCGSTCIQMLCRYYGRKLSLDFINEQVGLTNIGASVRDISEGLHSLHFQSVVVKCKCDKLAELPLPAILFWRNNHFVVLYKVDKTSFFIADPASGKVRFSKEEFLLNWCNGYNEGTVILALPTQEFYEVQFPQPSTTWKNVFSDVCRSTIRNRLKISLIIILILLSSICSWYIPLIYKNLIDKGVLAGNMPIVATLFFAQLSFFIGNLLFTSISSILLLKINSSVAIRYLGGLLNKIIRLPLKFFDNSLHTEMIQRFEDFNRLQRFISNTLISELFSVITLLVFSVLLASYNGWAVIIFYVFSLIAVLINIHYLRERKYIDYTRFAQYSRNYNNILEVLQGMRDIKISCAQTLYVTKWKTTQEAIDRLSVRSSVIEFKQSSWFSSINKLRDICIIGFCAFIAINGEITIGVLISTTYLLGMMTSPMDSLTHFFRNYQDAKISAERISSLQAKGDEETGVEIPTLNRGIEIRDVNFKYPGLRSQTVLKDISFFIPVGKITAIVGRSGCGKTTLMKLLLGFYAKYDGEILIDGIAFSNVDINRWRLKCGTVFQDGYIFSGTIMENIAMSQEIDEETLNKASELACADEFISKLPLKYNTQIGASGLNLSQGQKQRILIARALYKNPEMIIFDEATSSLDSVNESRIMENIFTSCNGKTVVIIAHRLSTIKNADQIIVMDQGSVVEKGTHCELLAKNGVYYHLVKNQLEFGAD